MQNLSYYDTLSNLIPGLVFIWALFVLGPVSSELFPLLLTGNTIIDSVLIIAIAYMIGNLTQIIGKISTEKIIQIVFWKGKRFSEIFLIKSYAILNDLESQRFLEIAKNLDFSDEDLSLLSQNNLQSDEKKLKTAQERSHLIYRTLDARTLDENKGQKAHLHNTFYSFYRNLATIFLILGVLDIICLFNDYAEFKHVNTGIILLNFLIMVAFIYQTKERGELYVKGLFWSYK